MSTDGTQPPSIAPRRPVAAPAGGSSPTAVRTAEAPVRPGSAPVSGPVAPSEATTVTGRPAERPASAERPTERATERTSERTSGRPSARPTEDRDERPGIAPAAGAPRRVRLAVARVDPWSVMKLSFLLSVAVGLMIVVAAAVVWSTLNELNVFTQVNDVIATLSGSRTFFDVLEFASFERTLSLATMVAVVDVVLLTALATIGAFLYNVVAALVGGIHLTLTDD